MKRSLASLVSTATVLTMLATAFSFGCKQKANPKVLDFSRSNCVSVVLGEADREHGKGIEHVYWEKDGLTKLATLDDKPCRCLKLDGREIGYLYFIIDPSFKKGDVRNVIIDVEYFDEKGGTLGLEFDASGPQSKPHASHTTAGLPARLQGTRTWQVAGFRVENATFNNGQNSKADFRLWARPPELYVRRVTVTRKAELEAAGQPRFGSPDLSKAKTVSADLGSPGTESGRGLRHIYYQDDGRSLATVAPDGELCRLVKRDAGRFGYLYFAIDRTFKKRNLENAVVEVEYFDTLPGSLGLEFDASSTQKVMNSAYASAGSPLRVKGSKTWQTAQFHIKNAVFRNSQNSGADFRLCISPAELYVRRVSISREAAAEPVAPATSN